MSTEIMFVQYGNKNKIVIVCLVLFYHFMYILIAQFAK